MTDYISRADAIEAVLTYFIPRSHTGERGEHEEDFVRTIFKELPSADAVHIHNDGTLEVKVPNAQKVGRVLVMDTDSHIGGGLFYPDDAEQTDKPNTALDEVFKESHDAFHKWEEDMYKGRPHGEWYQIKDHKIMGEGYLWHCSICDYKVYQDSSKDYPTENYCPNCGALMLKGGDDE